jgi:hypothetical protein
MAFDFLQRLPFIGAVATHKIVLTTTGTESVTAEKLMQELLTSLPETLAVALIYAETGRTLATYTTTGQYNLSKAASLTATMVRQAHGALNALGLADDPIEDVLITLGNQLHLVRLLAGGEWLLYVVAHSPDTNLALVRAVMEACAKQHDTSEAADSTTADL